jgi:phage-related protein
MAENGTLGASFEIDVTNLKAGLAQANRLIRENESEFRAAAAGMDDWSDNADGLNARIKSLNSITDIQRKKVNALQSEYDRLIAGGMDPMSKEAVELRTKINQETAALNKNEAELERQKQALAELGKESNETEKATEDVGSSFEGLKAAGGIAVKAIAAVGAACAGAITAFFGLAESTRETREAWAKLEASFNSAGHEFDYAVDTLYSLQGVLGDTDRAIEASNFLAKMSSDQEDLAANTRILTGVFAEYGESIPTEGLAEGMAATAAMGEVQGVLADALEWQGVNLEEYNKHLATLTTEEERAAYIQQTLTDIYGESADAYREANAEMIEANNAQLRLNTAMAELGAIAEPIMTTLKNLSAQLLMQIRPFVELIGVGLTDAFNGADGAADKLAEGLSGVLNTVVERIGAVLPFIVDTIVAVVPQLLSSLLAQLPTILSELTSMAVQVVQQLLPVILAQLPAILETLLQMVVQVAQELAGMMPTLIPVIVDAVVMLAETLLDNIDLIIDAGISLIIGLAEGLIKALPQLVAKIPVIIEKTVSAILGNLPKLVSAGVQLTLKLAAGLIQAIPQLVAQLPRIIMSIVNGFAEYYSDMAGIGGDLIRGLWQGISDMAGWIKGKIQGFGDSVLGALKDFFGIKSPSRVMADVVGKNLALGIGKGFEDNIDGVNDKITSAMEFDGASLTAGAGGKAGGKGGGVTVYQTNNYSQAHSRVELYKTKQATAAAVRLAMAGA